MSHATDKPKPWNKNYLLSAIKGVRPTTAEKVFWQYTSGPINIFNDSTIKRKKTAIKTASFIGRFYSKK